MRLRESVFRTIDGSGIVSGAATYTPPQTDFAIRVGVRRCQRELNRRLW